MHIKLTKIETCMYNTLLGLKNTRTYERVKPATKGLVRTENALFILFCLRK